MKLKPTDPDSLSFQIINVVEAFLASKENDFTPFLIHYYVSLQ